jgi:PKD repeat protein
VRLTRERSASQVDTLTLARVAPGVLAGRGRFYVALRCGGRVYPHGGVAYFSVRASVQRAQVVQGTRFATAIHATYDNWKRVNRTPCPGSLGRDAGVYSGRLSSPVPAAPTADFGSAVDSSTGTASFTDLSSSPTGAAIVRWQWDFGDPSSGPNNSSTERNPSHRYAPGASYNVTLTVTDSNGLKATVARQIAI